MLNTACITLKYHFTGYFKAAIDTDDVGSCFTPMKDNAYYNYPRSGEYLALSQSAQYAASEVVLQSPDALQDVFSD